MRCIHNLLHNRRAPDLLRDLAAISVNSPHILISKTDICNVSMSIQPRRVIASSLFTVDLLGTVIFCR